MVKVNLSGGFYIAQDVSAADQSCENLYPEPVNASDSSIPVVTYPTPGIKKVLSLSTTGTGSPRGMKTDSKGNLIVVVDSTVTQVMSDNTTRFIGNITGGTTPVSIMDNGLTLVIVDGNPGGFWYASLPTDSNNTYGTLVQWIDKTGQTTSSSDDNDDSYNGQELEAFPGSKTVAVMDQFFIFVQPNSRHFYVSPNDFTDQTSTPFDSTYIASKTTYPDLLCGVAVIGQYIWLLGEQTTEIWFNSGAADFPFERISGVPLQSGCYSPYSIASNNTFVFWLSRDEDGACFVYKGQGEVANVISTFSISNELTSYDPSVLANARGYTYRQYGHTFYVLTFPDNGKTWVYDVTYDMWHERSSASDSTGGLNRYRSALMAYAYGKVYSLDYENSNIYIVSKDYHTDNGTPIERTRSFPHAESDGLRIIHRKITINISGGAGSVNLGINYSDNRGYTYQTAESVLFHPESNEWPTLWALGTSRDRVYKISWQDDDENYVSSFFGGFIDADLTNY